MNMQESDKVPKQVVELLYQVAVVVAVVVAFKAEPQVSDPTPVETAGQAELVGLVATVLLIPLLVQNMRYIQETVPCLAEPVMWPTKQDGAQPINTVVWFWCSREIRTYG
jgi:hypothetical protein